MRVVLAAAVILTLTACAGHAKLAVSRDGRAVLADVYDGKLDRHWSCGSLRAAYRRLPQDSATYSDIPNVIGTAAGKACNAAFARVHVGDAPQKVVDALGAPDRTPRCWIYRWPPDSESSIDGARICFAAGRVAVIQTAEHG